ncbi:hypothetical protein [Marinicella sp. W31]|uniref:hypothetical protein n=1 Tax=Marinicella sp. W31 TaxID=3023713 RepID=UPI0037573D24
MKKLLTNLVATAALTVSACTAIQAAEINLHVLEQLEIDPNVQVAELTAAQFVGILQLTPRAPSAPPTCADFSAYAIGNSFPAGSGVNINGIDFVIHYSGGARISDWWTYPGDKFMEMVESGHLEIKAPFSASKVTLEVIQAGPDPVFAEIFDNGNPVSVLNTSLYNQKNLLSYSSSSSDTLIMHGVEAFVYEVCFYE